MFVHLCFHAFLRNTVVRRQQQHATLLLWSMFCFAPLLALLLLILFVWFRSLAYIAGRAAAVSDDFETARECNLFRTDPDRFLALEFVKAFPVHAASPFSLGEGEPVHCFVSGRERTSTWDASTTRR